MHSYRLRLDLQYFAGEKTEKATPRKRDDSRKKGQVAKSADLTSSFMLFAMFLVLYFFGPFLGRRFVLVLQDGLSASQVLQAVEEGRIEQILVEMLIQMGILVAPFFLTAVVIGVLGNFVQIGVLLSGEAIQPKLDRINPLQGVKRIVSVKALVEFLKSVFKLLVIGVTSGTVLWNNKVEISRLTSEPIGDALAIIGHLTFLLGLSVSIALIALAILDFAYQKFDFEKSIRMSKQDLKDEHKNTEGDPRIKGKIKQQQREMAMRRMMQEIPNADVVITNPTHYAVAIQYDDGKHMAPIVVAKGVDAVAFRIREKATAADVPIVENRPLARALFAQSEIGMAVDETFYQALAETLAFVYQLKQAK